MSTPTTPRKTTAKKPATAAARSPRKAAPKVPAAPQEPLSNPIAAVPYDAPAKASRARTGAAADAVEALPGDTLWRVAVRTLGVRNTPRHTAEILAERNRLAALNPNLDRDLPAGTTVRIR